MAATITIPRTTLQPGPHDFPPAGGQNVAGADTGAVLAVDRTVPGGLNAAAGSVLVTVAVVQSGDGGASWVEIATAGFPGGLLTDRATGGTLAQSNMGAALWPGTGRLVRARVTVTGTAVTVAGTLTVT